MSDSRSLLSSLGGSPEATPTPPAGAPPAPSPPARPTLPASAGPTLRPASAATAARYQEPAPARRSPTLLFSGVGVLLALGSGTAFLLKAPPPALVPAAYRPFAAPDGVFRCDIPNGWNPQPTGELAGEDRVNAQNGITMESGASAVEITLSTSAGLAHAQLLLGSSTVPESMGGSRANGINPLHRRAVKKRFADYKEVKQTQCPSRMGGGFFNDAHQYQSDALLYEFTGKQGNFLKRTPVHGYRAVVGGRDLIASVECHCSEAEWAKMRPVFRHVIGNLREIHPETAEEREAKQLLKQLESVTPPPPGS